MEEALNDHRLLDVIAILSSKGESGRLQIGVGTTQGAFFFKKGKLVDAHMGTLSGFPAVNAAISIREARFSFDPSIPPPTSRFNTLHERIVLKELFGIETADPEVGNDLVAVTRGELAVTRSREVPLSDATDPEWRAKDPQNGAHKQAQDGRRIRAEQELEKVEEAEDLEKRNATVEAQRMADEIREPVEEEARRKLEEKEGRTIAEQAKLAQTTSLAVMPEFPGNGTLRDSEKKLCPTCNHSYSDDSLNYCLDDGAPPSAAPDPVVTLVRRNPPSSKLRRIISYPLLPSSPSSYRRGLYVAILLVLIGAGAVALVQELTERRSPTTSAAKPSESFLPLPTQVSKQTEQKSFGAQDLTGQWKVVNIIEKTSYRSFTNLEIGFRLLINQTGRDFTAEGEKVSENGQILPATGRTPIHVIGSIDGERVEATFMEAGLRRKTSGRFVWRIENAGAGLTGTFVSTAARTSGTSAATKEL